MAAFEKDDIPMLSNTHAQFSDEHPDSRFQRFASTSRSASISIPMNSLDSYDSETNLVGYTGPLRSERRTPFTQMSGPLYVSRKPESLFPVNQGVTGRKKAEPVPEKFTSSRGKDQNDWPNDNYGAKNEHLLRSGQLGVCNDPYCTVCPTYDNFKATQQKNSKASSVFDPKVFFFLNLRAVLPVLIYKFIAILCCLVLYALVVYQNIISFGSPNS